MAEIELKNCPFCGAKAVFRQKRGYWRVQCINRLNPIDSCPVNGRSHDCTEKEDAAKYWNTRAEG